MKKKIIEVLQGTAFGVANIIPGVSGGTLALILGFYERLLIILESLKPALFQSLLGTFRTEGMKGLVREMQKRDLFFAMRLGIGAVLAILALSSVMKYLLQNQFSPTYSFFFGLILISSWVPFKLVQKWKLNSILALVVGVLLTVGVSLGVNPADKVRSKSKTYELQMQSQEELPQTGSFQGKYEMKEYIVIIGAGAIGVSAMLLPGISGSLLLILLGQYGVILGALSGLKKFVLDDFLFLGLFSLGMLLGMLAMTKGIRYCLKNLPDTTHGFLTGLVLGSLWALWPFKAYQVESIFTKGAQGIEKVNGYRLYSNQNLWYSPDGQYISSVFAIVAGIALMLVFLKRETSDS